jgi:hypothetical protein
MVRKTASLYQSVQKSPGLPVPQVVGKLHVFIGKFTGHEHDDPAYAVLKGDPYLSLII